MLRSSDENSTRGGSSPLSPDLASAQFPSQDAPSRTEISDAERAQIYAALSHTTTSPQISDKGAMERTNGVSGAQRSRLKKFGVAVKRIFVNDQSVRVQRRRRDSWDEIYRSKDNAKIRPIHEEYGVL